MLLKISCFWEGREKQIFLKKLDNTDRIHIFIFFWTNKKEQLKTLQNEILKVDSVK